MNRISRAMAGSTPSRRRSFAAAIVRGALPPCTAQTEPPGIGARPHRSPVPFDVAVHCPRREAFPCRGPAGVV
jgi:hypothetical protein